MLVRERFSSISAAISIRSKPNSRFQTLCVSCISKLRIFPRRCVAASFATRTVSRRHQIVVPRSSDILAKSRSSTVISKSDKKRCGSRSPDTFGVSNDLQKNPRFSRVPWVRTPRAPSTGASYTGALLAALSVGSSAVCTRRTVFALLSWCCRPVMLLLSAGAGTDRLVLQPHSRLTPLGSCTGHEVLALVRPVVPYSSLALSSKRARPVVSLAPSVDRCSNPSFSLQGCSSSQALLSFTNSSDFKIPQISNTRRLVIDALTRSRNLRFVPLV